MVICLAEWVVPEKGPLNGCVCACANFLPENLRVKQLLKSVENRRSYSREIVAYSVDVL